MSISQSQYDFSQQQFYHAYLTHTHIYIYIYIYIYICQVSHILWKNLQAYNIECTVQQEKEHKNQGSCQALGIVWQLNEFCTIPSQPFTTYNSQYIVSGMHLTTSK